ncbi:alkaline phosphatase, tissue-nonspecific isozyme [Scaptodrosophila lebanonensis]|uniref:alkaline phosphatase n=1 Tax=Drosophila lebanonensis TaxID=7225 RepID=A0A6J2TM47_DROLE|nr:alkaline phosphatase, tissue-nonspecific isozyme [Scaptodrosophila lebanonensis]
MRYEVDNEVANVMDVSYWKDKVSPEQQFWYDKGIEELSLALSVNEVPQHPRNVLLFLVNGFDASDLAAARFPEAYSNTRPSNYIWDNFPNVARIRNSCSLRDGCDAGTVATALFGGVRANWHTVGVDSAVAVGNCSASLTASHQVQSVIRQAQMAGLRTGFVTTQRVTGATGAALYAHSPDSSWECDAAMAFSSVEEGCRDVALQLVYGATGSSLNVVLGGGRQMLSTELPKNLWDIPDELLCQPADGRNLLREWQTEKQKHAKRFELVQSASQLQALNASSLDYLLGVMANGDLENNPQAPKLQLMLDKALQVLRLEEAGYLLVAEQYMSQSVAEDQFKVLRSLNETITTLIQNAKETLFLVLFTKGDYMEYGSDTSGEKPAVDNLWDVFEDDSLLELRLKEMFSESVLFAKGPKSSLFYGVRDDTYLAHALAYALKIAPLTKG